MAPTKRFLVVGTEDGSVLWLTHGSYRVARTQRLRAKLTGFSAICALHFTPSYKDFVALSLKGTFHYIKVEKPSLLDSEKDDAVKPYTLGVLGMGFGFRSGSPVPYEAHALPQLATDFTNGTRMVTYNVNGTLSVWAILNRTLLCYHHFQAAIQSVSSSPDGLLIAVGLSSGVLCALDASRADKLRLVKAVRYHVNPVIKVLFNAEGDVIMSTSKEAMYFVRPSDFKVLGRIELFALLRTPLENQMLANNKSNEAEQQEKSAMLVSIPGEAEEDKEDMGEVLNVPIVKPMDEAEPMDGIMDVAWLGYSSESSKYQRMVISTRYSRAIVFTAPNAYFEDCDSHLRMSASQLAVSISKLDSCALNLVASNRERNVFLALTEDKQLSSHHVADDGTVSKLTTMACHKKNGSSLAISSNGLLASTGSDGRVIVRHLQSLDIVSQVAAHDWKTGGGRSVAFTEDGRILITSGEDGGIFVWNVMELQGDSRETIPIKTALSIREKVLEQLPAVMEPGVDSEVFNPLLYAESQSERQSTELGQTGDSRQKVIARDLLRNIERFKKMFQSVMKRNDEAPDAEKLGLLEFAVDVELRDQLIQQGKERTDATREEMTRTYKGKELVAKRIKEQCWDSMDVKGELFKAFKDEYEVTNFPIRSQTTVQQRLLKKICFQRKLQIMESRYLYGSGSEKGSFNKFDPAVRFTTAANYLMKLSPQPSMAGEKEEIEEQFPPYFLLHQMECITGIRKRMQAWLLAAKIEDIKKAFNKKFVSCYESKKIEIENVREKNKRIKEIQEELSVPVDLFHVSMAVEEMNDRVLKVDDSEVKSVRVLTKEEQIIFDKQQEIERQKALNRDDAPERALNDFMGGTLQTKREQSILDQTLEREDWMDYGLDEMTDEQRAAFAQFQKSEEELQEAKDNHRKLLQTELTKLKNEVQEIRVAFDTQTKDLLEERVMLLQQLFQHELMIIRIMTDLSKEERSAEEEEAIHHRLVELEKEKKRAHAVAASFSDRFDEFGLLYERLALEERTSEKNFRKEFADAPDHLDYLHKLFKQAKAGGKESKPKKDESKKKKVAEEEGLPGPSVTQEAEDPLEEEICLDPFATDQNDTPIRDQTVDAVPEDMDPALWDRFLAKKKFHFDLEARVIKAGQTHEEMNVHLVSLQTRDREIGEEIKILEERARMVAESRTRLALNTEMMVNTKQGQVEIEEAPVVTDLKDCEMIEKGIVEELNRHIQKHGKEKVSILEEIKVSRSAINLLKWQKKKLVLEHKDAVDLTTELQLLRVTKGLQALIKIGGQDNQKAAELKRLDRKIEFLNHSTREKALGKKVKLLQVKKKIRQQNKENDRLLVTVQELEAAVRERVQITNIRGGATGDEAEDRRQADHRMKALVTRRKLVDLAKLQAEEIKFLRDQVESLRKRTFASFAVPHVPANPDERRHEYSEHRSASSMDNSRPKSRARSKGGMTGTMGGHDDRAVTR